MSRPPKTRAASANAPSTARQSRTSAGAATARPPMPTISAAVASISSGVRATQQTAAPWRAYASAIALPMPRPAPVTAATFPASVSSMSSAAPHGSDRRRELVGIDRNLDDGRPARGQRGADDVADLVRMIHVVPRGAEEPGEVVVARVADVAADVAPSEEVLLVGLLRSPAIVVHHQRDHVDPMAHGGLELVGVHEEAAV